jgi:hypothetical protein
MFEKQKAPPKSQNQVGQKSLKVVNSRGVSTGSSESAAEAEAKSAGL